MSTLDDYLFQVGKAASQFQFLEEGRAPGGSGITIPILTIFEKHLMVHTSENMICS